MTELEKLKPKKLDLKILDENPEELKSERRSNGEILASSLTKEAPEMALKILGRIDFTSPERALREEQIIDTEAFLNVHNLSEPEIFKYRNDPELQKQVARHKTLILEPGTDEKLRNNSRLSLKELIKRKLSIEYPDQRSFGFSMALFEGSVRRTDVLQKAINKLKTDSPEKVTEFFRDFSKLHDRYEKKEIDKPQYLKQYDVLVEKTVEQTGDEKLKQTWQTYQKEERASFQSIATTSENAPSTTEQPIKTESESKTALQKEDIAITGGELRMQSSNTAAVHFQEGLTIGLSIYKDQNTDQYIFYLDDEFLREPIRIKAQDLKQSLDKRRIDAFISQKLAPYDSDNDPVAEIPENNLTNLIEQLLGSAQDRNYQFREADYLIMENLAKVLGEKDQKYPSFEQKLTALTNFFSGNRDKASEVSDKLKLMPKDQAYQLNDLIS